MLQKFQFWLDRAFALPSLDQLMADFNVDGELCSTVNTLFKHLDRAPMLRVESWGHAFSHAADLAVEAAKEHVAVLSTLQDDVAKLKELEAGFPRSITRGLLARPGRRH